MVKSKVIEKHYETVELQLFILVCDPLNLPGCSSIPNHDTITCFQLICGMLQVFSELSSTFPVLKGVARIKFRMHAYLQKVSQFKH